VPPVDVDTGVGVDADVDVDVDDLKFQCWLAPPLESQIWTVVPLAVWPPGVSRARPLATLVRV
jgi:hypothetical protein